MKKSPQCVATSNARAFPLIRRLTVPLRPAPHLSLCLQYGLLYLTYPNGAGAGVGAGARGPGGTQRVRPSAHLTVRWELPAGCIDGVGRPRRELAGGAGEEPQRLMVGLFRLGVASNTAGIISKKMFERTPRGTRDPREMLFGTVPFYAPKSVSFFHVPY